MLPLILHRSENGVPFGVIASSISQLLNSHRRGVSKNEPARIYLICKY